MLKGRLRTLSFIVLICFLALAGTGYFLQNQTEQVRTLESHKDILINRLSEEVFHRKKLERDNDSLRQKLDEEALTHKEAHAP